MTDADLTPDAARDLLTVADAARERGDDISRRALLGPAMSAFIGLLLGAFLLASIYLFPTATPLQGLLISGGYAVGILASVTAYNVGRRATPTGWLQRYQKGLALSCGVFAVALALSFLVEERSAALWVPLAVATALPIAILGSTRARR
ncbi:hypothetical protein GCM10025867_17440 [Frondihabitans sucicola]|uniref:Uncharacterized protein n=1 Tax=Frondihabitans sucicola TaxID=1268041 RepID=A0ABN6Y0K8_9MICO|nr:hypothetical protein [Frondihabitans sucicola]BDZ49503.1 hypothetical protein GCM10025867_17440 [Frondihabitans sucicola]